MVEISRELDQRIYGDVYERLAALPTDGVPPDVLRMIEMRRAILAAEEAVTAAQRALPVPDMIARMAAEDQRTAAENAFVQHVEELHTAGRLEAALAYVENTAAERPEVIAARAEQERLAREAEERAAADAARFVPQAEEAARPQLYMNAEFAFAGLLMEVRNSLPADPAPYANNPIIQQLITANAQGEDAYYETAQRIANENFANGNLDRALYSFRDQNRDASFAPTATAEAYQQRLLMNNHLERLAAIPADATNVPPAMANLVTLARELQTMRTAPEGTHTAVAIEAKTFDYVQEGLRLDRQQVPVATFLQERYPNVIEGVGNYLSALPEVAWNNPGILLQSAENFVGSTVGLVGDVADLGDAMIGGVLNNRFFQLGSPKQWFGGEDVMLGDVVKGAVVSGLDFFTGRPEVRANSNDQRVLDGTENALDGIAIVATLGGAGLVKGGVKAGVHFGLRQSDEVAAVTLRAADDVAPAATATLTNITGSLGAALPRIATQAQETVMGWKNSLIRMFTRSADEVPPAVVRNADEIAPAARVTVPAAATGISTTGIVSGLATAFTTAAASVRNYVMGSPTRLGLVASHTLPAAVVLGASVYESNSGGAGSQFVLESAVSATRALVESGHITRENIGTAIRESREIADAVNSLDTSSINSAAYMGRYSHSDPNSQEAITDAKNQALITLLMPINAQSLTISHFLRLQIIDQVIPNQQEANRVLAEELIEDILSKTRVNVLQDHPITRDDLKAHLANILANPSHPMAAAMAPILNNGRLADGLRQIWPDLYQQPAATQPGATTTRPTQQPNDFLERMQGGLQNISTQLGNIPGLGWLGPIFAAIAAIVGFVRDMFNGNNSTAQTDNPNRLQALAANLGETPNLPRVTHDGTPVDPITTTPEERRTVIPGVTPGMTHAVP